MKLVVYKGMQSNKEVNDKNNYLAAYMFIATHLYYCTNPINLVNNFVIHKQ